MLADWPGELPPRAGHPARLQRTGPRARCCEIDAGRKHRKTEAGGEIRLPCPPRSNRISHLAGSHQRQTAHAIPAATIETMVLPFAAGVVRFDDRHRPPTGIRSLLKGRATARLTDRSHPFVGTSSYARMTH
uniref:Uncharacterized protein n=1 Tax=Anopheles albimanus TaxID=7167 RepID=A0A182FXR8_ANOAL